MSHIFDDLRLRKGYEWQSVDRTDLSIANLATGFALGFGVLTCRNAWDQVHGMRNPWRSLYVWYIILEVISNIGYGSLIYFLLMDYLKPNFWVFFFIAFFWTFEVQCLLQIICNRIAMIEINRGRAKWIKWIVFALVGAINASVFIIWIPARLQVSHGFVVLNEVWDRIEKSLYLVIDLALNMYFIRTVKVRLVRNGLQKYNKLVKFNSGLIVVSIAMDVILIASMSLKNGLVYGTLHPVTYIVKLNIELSLARLIAMIAREKGTGIRIDENERMRDDSTNATATMQSTKGTVPPSYCIKCAEAEDEEKAIKEEAERSEPSNRRGRPVVVRRTQEVVVTSNTRKSMNINNGVQRSDSTGPQRYASTSPLQRTGAQGWDDDETGSDSDGIKGSYTVEVSGHRSASMSRSSL